MTSITEIMQLCRLCLVKEQVNIPIFEEQGDLQQIIEKISACLPVKVSKEDKLPKKICDGCSYKLELLYQFRNTTVTAEKQLLSWINQLGGNKVENEVKSQPATQHIVKEEVEIVDTADHPDTEYLLGQQITFEGGDTPFLESQDDNGAGDDEITNSSDDEPLAKRRKRLLEDQGQISAGESKEGVVQHMAVTKTEDASDSEGEENVDDPEPNFVSVGTDDIQQPGPSGVGKAATTDIPITDCKSRPIDQSGLQCQFCNKRLPNREKLRQHQRQHQPKVFACNLCSKSYKKNYELTLHKRTHEKRKSLPCGVCGKMLSTKASLKMHMQVCHFKYYPFRCDQCDKGYLCESLLNAHKQTAHFGVTYKCEICTKMYKCPQSYKSHMRTHEMDYAKPEHICTICSKALHSKHSLRNHILTHDSMKKFICEICGKGVGSAASLETHRRGHKGEKPFACKYCPKKFVSSSVLRGHERIHTNEKPYVCKTCDKGFNQYGSYKIHSRIHTGERPYGCHVCDKRFPSRTALNTHLKKH